MGNAIGFQFSNYRIVFEVCSHWICIYRTFSNRYSSLWNLRCCCSPQWSHHHMGLRQTSGSQLDISHFAHPFMQAFSTHRRRPSVRQCFTIWFLISSLSFILFSLSSLFCDIRSPAVVEFIYILLFGQWEAWKLESASPTDILFLKPGSRNLSHPTLYVVHGRAKPVLPGPNRA